MKLPRLLAIASLAFGPLFVFPSAQAAMAGNVQITCATTDGQQRTSTVSWDNSQQFFEGKGNIAQFYCEGGYSGNYRIFVSSSIDGSNLLYYNGVAPTPVVTPSPEPVVETPTATETPAPESQTATEQPVATPSDTRTPTSETPTVVENTDTSTPVSETPTVIDTSTSSDTSTIVVPQVCPPLCGPDGPVPPEPPHPDPGPPAPPVVKPEPTPVPEPQPEPTPEPEPEPEPETQPNTEPQPEPVPEPEVQPEIVPEEETVPIDIEPSPEPVVDSESPEEPLEPPVVSEPTVTLDNGVVLTQEQATAVALLQDPAALLQELFTDPGAALAAFGQVGADMSPEVREQSEKVVISAVIAGNIATVSAGAAAYRRKA